MPGRVIPLVTDEIYHVYNRGIDHRPTFLNKKEFERGMETAKFYKYTDLPVRLSIFLIWAREKRDKLLGEYNNNQKQLIDTLSYCLMPNHFHFLLKQKVENGIAKFMSNFQNSYTKYFNTKHQRVGPLFLDQFKAVRIETEEQLLHVSRYIHLNPYTSYVVKNLQELNEYQWSSLPRFLERETKNDLINPEPILSFFHRKSSFQRFTFDQADYQRELEKIKHLIME